ncbi:hypothetical protein [Alteromonas gilva]|uniref:Uncharacterized protein n=1 Tax=Alteromonas gilva TaxID=2987522 RepID=A0ABT5KYF0_9ALTE|nr:hypothetical protein [Alteromonas gilva]MDC8829236.1 hypothetical protein [Alteromonas gilva]
MLSTVVTSRKLLVQTGYNRFAEPAKPECPDDARALFVTVAGATIARVHCVATARVLPFFTPAPTTFAANQRGTGRVKG